MYQGFTARRRLRTIEFKVEFEESDHLSAAIKDAQAWLTLSGKHLAIEREWAYRYGNTDRTLKITCLIG